VPEEALTPDNRENHPVRFDEKEEALPPSGERGYSPDEEEELSRRLRGLGYV
jgi:hypothetical protein